MKLKFRLPTRMPRHDAETVLDAPISIPLPANAELEPTVRTRNLTFAFGRGETAKQVLIDVDFELQKGELVVLTGPSGSGKTTLLTLVGALRSMQGGELSVLGHSMAGLNERGLVDIRRQIGFIFQMHNLFESVTAVENVMLAMQLHRYPREEVLDRATNALERLGMGGRLHHKSEALSGGQRQRVAIARALVNEPPLILADEPTAALDKQSGRDVVEILRSLADSKTSSIIMVTHDNRILDVADRIVHMVDGRISASGAPLE